MSKYVSAYSYPRGFLGLTDGQWPSSCHSQTFQHFRDQSGHWARDGRVLSSWSGYSKVGSSAGNRSRPSACNDPVVEVVVVPVVVVVVVLVVDVAVVVDIVDHLHVMIDQSWLLEQITCLPDNPERVFVCLHSSYCSGQIKAYWWHFHECSWKYIQSMFLDF